jgi:6,7-dimethyl-8-ribityllumazine synthase
MNQTHHTASNAKAAPLRIAVITAQWHAEIVGQAHAGLLAELDRVHDGPHTVQRFDVPGAFEMPLHAQRLALSGRFDAIVACALVVDGGIYRHEFVAAAVVDGLMRVQLDTGVPVLSVSLTPKDFHEHDDHQTFYRQHFVKKGAEAARACVAAVAGLRAIDAWSSRAPARGVDTAVTA